jgi:hypothetical protein
MDPRQRHMGSHRESSLSHPGRLPELLFHPSSKGKLNRARSQEIQHTGPIQPIHDRRLSLNGRDDHRRNVVSERIRVSPLPSLELSVPGNQERNANAGTQLCNVPSARLPRQAQH